jgi:hypothetical protein
MKTVKTKPPFRKLVGTGRFGGDPSKGQGHPHSNGNWRNAVEDQLFEFSDGTNVQGMMTGTIAVSTAKLTVQNTDGAGNCELGTGFVYLTLGDVRMEIATAPPIVALAAYPSPTLLNVAGALTTMLGNLPGFTATNAGLGVVNITGPTGPGGGLIPFSVEHLGTKVDFVLSPTSGSLTVGGPTLGPAIQT